MRPRVHCAVAAAVVALLVSPASGTAHERSSSRSMWVVDDNRIHITLSIAAHDVATGMLGVDPERSKPETVADTLTAQLDARTPTGPCSPDPSTFHPLAIAAGQLSWEWELRCPEPVSTITIESRLLSREAPHHLHVIRIRAGGTTVDRLLSGSTRSTEVTLDQSDALSFVSALRVGVDHLLGGSDHLVFLLALVIASTTLRTLAIAVTGFTVGHSVTLALATLGWVRAPTLWIEALIGLSIVFVALERVLLAPTTSVRSGARALLAGAFGLVHGLGFAGALVDRALPRGQLVTALFGFNIGIELAQLLVAAGAWTMFRLLRRKSSFVAALGLDIASAFTCAAGMYWTITRLAQDIAGS